MLSEIPTIYEVLKEHWYYVPAGVMWSVLIVYAVERWAE